jgi:hypothetical protein
MNCFSLGRSPDRRDKERPRRSPEPKKDGAYGDKKPAAVSGLQVENVYNKLFVVSFLVNSRQHLNYCFFFSGEIDANGWTGYFITGYCFRT